MQPLSHSYKSLVSPLQKCNISNTETPIIPNPNTLPGLIPELLLSISDFLYSADIIAVSLCNRRLLAVLSRYIKFLPPHRHSGKLSILEILARDLPDYFICQACIRLHRYDGSKCLGITEREWKKACGIECWSRGQWDSCRLHRRIKRYLWIGSHGINLNFLTRLLVRTYLDGPPPRDTADSIFYTQIQAHPQRQSLGMRMISLVSVEARICPTPMGVCLRVQDMLLVRDNQLCQLRATSQTFPLCEHSYSAYTELMALLLRFFRDPDKPHFFTYTCGQCNTDSLVQLCDLHSLAVLVITRWMIHGPGLNPDSHGWRVYCEGGVFVRRVLELHGEQVRPRSCFDQISSLPLEDLQSSNMDYLSGPRYRELMSHA